MRAAIYKAFWILDKLLDIFVILVCVLLLCIGIYSMLDNLWLYQNAQDRSVLQYKPDLNTPLGEDDQRVISENQVAWIWLEDTTIDYPVLQGKDNYEYLNKDPYGEFELSGSIFLDYRNADDFTDAYSVIYGHHMDYGAMFGALDAYQEQEYFDAHRHGKLVTKSAAWDYELFAVAEGEGTDEVLFNPSGQTTLEITEYLKKNALIYIEHEDGAPIVALSTCTGDTDTSRLLVFGTLK